MEDSIALVREGYRWGPARRGSAPAVPVRMLGRRAVLVGGPEGVRRFYDPRLRRRGAVPLPVRRVLFGAATVHGLDDAEHHDRKALFLDVLTADRVAALGRRSDQLWATAMRRWTGDVVLFDQAVQVLGASVLPWAGVPVHDGPGRSRQLAAVIDGFATPGPAWLRAAAARASLDLWSRNLVRQARKGVLDPAPGTALRVAAGSGLPVRAAATELLNVVRPTIATAWFVAFAGQALAEHPQWRERVRTDHAAAYAFAQEVRRRSPFVPVLAARARDAQDVLGVPVPKGGLVVLDVHGTDHDPAWWLHPEEFAPERFLAGARCPVEPDALVPQGGGDAATGHRCPGESVVLTLLISAVRALAGAGWTLPPQDLTADPGRMPTRPASGVVLSTGR
jgi:fatty-acid peroxygenase